MVVLGLLYCLDLNEMYEEKARSERHQNDVWSLEQLLEAGHHKIVAALPLTTHLANHAS